MKKNLTPACRGGPELYPEDFCLGRREVCNVEEGSLKFGREGGNRTL